MGLQEGIGIESLSSFSRMRSIRIPVQRNQAPFFRGSWIADYPDAESYFTMFYSKNPAPPNYTNFSNPAFDQLYEKAILENNDAMRYELYQKMDQIIIEEAPVIFLFYDETALFAQKNIEGLSVNAINLLSLKRVKKK